MKPLAPEADWPPSWQSAHVYDRMELWGDTATDPGYASSYRVRRRIALDLVAQVAPAGGRVLDVAAAQGNFSLELAERGYDVTWNDIREELAGYVARKHEHGRISYLGGNVLDVEPTADYDVVLATEVIEHVAHPDRFLAHLGRFLRPGGHVVLTTPNGAFVRNELPRFSDHPDPSAFESVQFRPNADGHIWLLHPDELPPLAAAAGLTLRELRLFETPLTAGWLKTAPLLRVLPTRTVDVLERTGGLVPRPLRERLMTHIAVLLRLEESVTPAARA
jgi:2-polyprenyl-6-hydroxyphenyl methylase/3-demethylubiquinone-9 3-methyltransferase